MRKKGRSPISIWEGTPNLCGEENPNLMGFVATTGPSRSAETSVTELVHSFLHWKAARPQILTNTDSVDGRDENLRLRSRAYGIIIFTKFELYISQKVQKAKNASRKPESRNIGNFRCVISA